MPKLADAVAQLSGLRVLVAGDVSLDEYIFGRAMRLSREAPIPVLEFERREIVLGGAANPTRNIVALGSHAIQVGVVGDDREGEQLRAALEQSQIASSGLIRVAGRPTTLKTRVLAHESPRLPQQVARLDRLDRSALQLTDEQRILDALDVYVPQVDAVLCSDYQLGLLSSRVVDHARMLCQRYGALLTVDAQGNSHYYHDVTLFRCNDREASAALGTPLRTENDFRQGVEWLQNRLRARTVIVTRGPDGLSLLDVDLGYVYVPAVDVSEVYDTTGAGDTFIAVVTLGLAAGLDSLTAAHLANIAASRVVQKIGNVVVSPEELMQVVGESGMWEFT